MPWIFLMWNIRNHFFFLPNISQSLGLWHVLICFTCTQIAYLKMMLHLHPIELILMYFMSYFSHWVLLQLAFLRGGYSRYMIGKSSQDRWWQRMNTSHRRGGDDPKRATVKGFPRNTIHWGHISLDYTCVKFISSLQHATQNQCSRTSLTSCTWMMPCQWKCLVKVLVHWDVVMRVVQSPCIMCEYFVDAT